MSYVATYPAKSVHKQSVSPFSVQREFDVRAPGKKPFYWYSFTGEVYHPQITDLDSDSFSGFVAESGHCFIACQLKERSPNTVGELKGYLSIKNTLGHLLALSQDYYKNPKGLLKIGMAVAHDIPDIAERYQNDMWLFLLYKDGELLAEWGDELFIDSQVFSSPHMAYIDRNMLRHGDWRRFNDPQTRMCLGLAYSIGPHRGFFRDALKEASPDLDSAFSKAVKPKQKVSAMIASLKSRKERKRRLREAKRNACVSEAKVYDL